MYGLYSKIKTSKNINFKLVEEISIFGCNSGFIPWLLKFHLNESNHEPLKWHLKIEDELNRYNEYSKTCIIIDFKPKNKVDDYILLGELTDVWGYSDSDWTPLLFRVEMLYTDLEAKTIDKKKFSKKTNEENDVVYTYLYAKGSIKNGKLFGTWNAPSTSPTNSALLWPETLKYFHSEIKKCDQNILK
ncbi:MAG TPA: hypothetical protein P5295_17280 [Spirochaetota bacterium]|nr:hypothetical protein [Spirochaetota bacterium]